MALVPAMTEVIRLSRTVENDFPCLWYELATASHFWMGGRRDAFLTLVRAAQIPLDRRLHGLEIGCGAGVVRRQLEAATAWVVDGADINLPADMASDVSGRTFLYDVGDRHPELGGSYDFVLLFDVIEHIDDPVRFLQDCAFHLRPSGWMFINVPAFECLRSRYDEVAGHHIRYDQRTLATTLEEAGLAVIEQRYWGFTLVPLLLLRRWLPTVRLSDDEIVRRGFRPPSPCVNRLLGMVLRLESKILRRPPMGTSLLTVARGPGGADTP